MDSTKTKILLIGPSASGKSIAADIIAEVTSEYRRPPSSAVSSPSPQNYRPTHAVRILELERGLPSNSRDVIAVEIWDVSGDVKFKNCWPAIQQDAAGVIFFYNPESSSHVRQLDEWYQIFALSAGLQPHQCWVVECFPNELSVQSSKIQIQGRAAALSASGCLPPHSTSFETIASSLRPAFDVFLERLVAIIRSSKHQKEEKPVIGQS